jgi:arylsulfatase A-like enzyme
MARPNVVVILADDMGYSDLGCYGGEIRTRHLDGLGREGVRLSQFYTTARCSPSRASLLTGLHPHQAGIGVLTNDDSPDGYPGSLNSRCVTMAEVLSGAGYATCMVGKWHLSARMTEPAPSWPTRRGFERFFGTMSGAGSYYRPGRLFRDEADASAECADPEFFYTDAISAEAERFVRDRAGRDDERPFFLYTAYTAPHWPLHAPEADIASYDGVFDAGWDELRGRRMDALAKEGILPADTGMSDRDPTQPAWADVTDQGWQRRRMQAYAAQIERMDRGIGRILQALRDTGQWENTLVLFLSDNGASDEELPKYGARFGERTDILPPSTRDGRPIRVGNSPDIVPGPEDTYASYGRAWANLSNTPFRFYKRWVHEGGIAAPCIAHWPAGQLADGGVVTAPFQLVDVLPTVLDATRSDYPSRYRGRDVLPLEGRSMLPALRGGVAPDASLYWEHTGNAALRRGNWKLVREYPHDWELYDIDRDRCETHDRAAAEPEVVAELAGDWRRWAERVGVLPWETTLRIYRERGLTDEDAAG